MPVKVAAKALKPLGVKLDIPASRDAVEAEAPGSAPTPSTRVDEALRREREQQQAREQLERTFRRRLLDQVREKFKGPLKRDDLQTIADRWISEHDVMDLPLYDWYYGGRINTDKMTERELLRLLLELGLWSPTEYLGESPAGLLAIAKRLKIDQAKVRKQVKAELGGEPEAVPAPKKKARKK